MAAGETTLRDLMRRAVEEQDAHAAGRIVDHLRFRCGRTYRDAYELVNSYYPITEAAWDALLAQADMEESR